MQSGTHGRSHTHTQSDRVRSRLSVVQEWQRSRKAGGIRLHPTTRAFRRRPVSRSVWNSTKSTDDAPISNALIGMKFSENRGYDSPLLPYQG